MHRLASSTFLPATTVLIMAVLGVGCGPVVFLEDDSGSSGDDGDTTTTTTSAPPGTTVPGTTAPPPPATTAPPPSSDTTGFEDTGSVFIPEPETWGGDWWCTIFDQDCPPGEKCMPWANDGGSNWNATRCSPVVDDPDGVGETCLVEGSGVSGVDTCDYGSMCWGVDPETLQGTCVAFCVGSEDNPLCESETATCAITNDGVLALCLPICDPLLQDCADGQACYLISDAFSCAPDSSGDMGMPGTPCELINACDPGSFCTNTADVPDCVGRIGCCSPFCALDDPMPPCLPGQECVPWYEPGAAPPGYENVGGCTLPM